MSSDLVVLLYQTNYGALRRQKLLKKLNEYRGANIVWGGSIPVNRRYCAQLSQDPDLKKLLKQGKLKRVRGGIGKTRTTYLELA